MVAAGKPYYPVLLPDNFVDEKYLKGFRPFPDFASLRRAVEAGAAPDMKPMLNFHTSQDDIPDPVERVWAVLRGDVISSSPPPAPAEQIPGGSIRSETT